MSVRSDIAACVAIDAPFRLSTGEVTTSRALLNGLVDDFEDMLFVPNSYLPERLHGHKETIDGHFGRSVKSLKRELKEKPVEIDHKADNLNAYCDQIPAMASPEELRFIEDERRLNNAQVNFLRLLYKMGKVDESLDLVTA